MKKGFTLVELAIVIVIIGLLVGGVFQGQELVEQSKQRRLIKDFESYKAAAYTFKSKFAQFPGDSTSAFQVWGTACAANANLCNGNGDDRVDEGTLYASWNDNEVLRFWQHLTLAKIIPGTYPGTGFIGTGNAPVSTVNNGTMTIQHGQNYDTNWLTVPSQLYKNYFRYGKCLNNNAKCTDPAVTSEMSYNIDLKIDDGSPDRGNVAVMIEAMGLTPNCRTGTYPNSTYRISYSGLACNLNYTMD